MFLCSIGLCSFRGSLCLSTKCGIINYCNYARRAGVAANLLYYIIKRGIKRGIFMLIRLKDILNRYRTALLGLAIFLVSLFVLVWIGLQTSREVRNVSSYRIVNDEYDTVLELGREPAVQTILLSEAQQIYGVRLDFSTYDRVCRGTLQVSLQNGNGSTVGEAALQGTELLDNTFADVLLNGGQALELSAGEYTICLSFSPETDEDRLGVWYTPQTQQSMALQTGGTLALQWIIEYSANWFPRFYAAAAVLMLAAVMIAWTMLCVRPQKLWKVFAVESAVLGMAFSLVTPPMVAPDEYAHLAGSYALASRMLGQTAYNEEGQLLMRACDAPYMKDETGDAGVLAYKRMAEHLSDRPGRQTADTPVDVRISATGINLLYIPQAAGTALARIMGLGFFAMLLMGRLCSLAVYTALGAFAVAHIPRGKTLLLCTGLLPMGLQLAASYSADTLVTGLAFAMLAVCMNCVYRQVRRRDIVLLLALSALIGPSKAIYVVLVGLVFMIPASGFSSRLCAVSVKLGCCAAAVLGWLACNRSYFDYIYRDVDYMGVQRFAWKAALALAAAAALWKITRRRPRARRMLIVFLLMAVLIFIPVGYYMLSHMWGGLTPDEIAAGIQPNGDSIYTFTLGYICRNLPGTLKILLNTLGTQIPGWIQGVLGLSLGEPIVYPVYASWLYGIGLILVLLTASLPCEGVAPRINGWRRWWLLLLALGVGTLSLLACLTWTPINYTVLFGVQGRYFLPILPLVLLALGEQRAICKRKNLTSVTVFWEIVLCVLVMADGLNLYATL